jgi:hypothetical protein
MPEQPGDYAQNLLRAHGVDLPQDPQDPCVLSIAGRLRLLDSRIVAYRGLLDETRVELNTAKRHLDLLTAITLEVETALGNLVELGALPHDGWEDAANALRDKLRDGIMGVRRAND